ncbi:MAG: hypothetical protein IJP75_10700 [Bacteroidaceae bacterium]|nr:hypothetical protein [Bacteroidaceae bacterium]
MNTESLFDFHAYMASLVEQNRLAQQLHFKPCTCTGINGLQGVLDGFLSTANFVATDDITPGQTVQHGGGWFQRRTFTVFILMRCAFGDEGDRQQKLAQCRNLMRQFQSRFIMDEAALQSELTYLGVDRMTTTDIGSHFMSGCTGLYFMVNIDEPVDLSYNADEWL